MYGKFFTNSLLRLLMSMTDVFLNFLLNILYFFIYFSDKYFTNLGVHKDSTLRVIISVQRFKHFIVISKQRFHY